MKDLLGGSSEAGLHLLHGDMNVKHNAVKQRDGKKSDVQKVNRIGRNCNGVPQLSVLLTKMPS